MTIDLKQLFKISDELDERMINQLLKALKDGSSTNFDYIRFKQSVNALSEMNMDEATSIKSAFSTAATMGFTKDELIKSAYNYTQILKKEREEFATALKNQIELNVTGKLQEIEDVKAQISSNEKKMEQLQKENEILGQKIGIIEDQVSKSKEKIDHTKSEFLLVYEAFESKIGEDISRFEAVL